MKYDELSGEAKDRAINGMREYNPNREVQSREAIEKEIHDNDYRFSEYGWHRT